MAIVISNNAEFLHIPKTGGSWVTSILESQNFVESKSLKHADYDYNLLFKNKEFLTGRQHLLATFHHLKNRFSKFESSRNQKELITPFRFCFVRHPLSWYESWWRYMEGRGWNDWGEINSAKKWHPNAVLNGLGSHDFNEFIWNVIQKRPGYVSELFFSYTKPGISFIGKTENLRNDLISVLEYLDLFFDKSVVLNSIEKNVSQTPKTKIEWDPQLKQTLLRLELPALVHFGYLNQIEQFELGIKKFIPPNNAIFLHSKTI